ncbi:MAG TPA: PKD domain-containing protein [Gemmatimonadales bacterium]|nr:PKD domain-containing protein [Gemmatimonadales bacterium]
MPTLSALEAQLPPLRPSLARDTASTTPRARAGRWLTLAGLLLVACQGGDGLLLPSEGEPAAIEVVRGDGQSGRVGEPLADALVVEVTDTRNRPVEGATVTFELTSAGPGADIVPHTATTDANGQANAQIVLGTTIGRQTGEARLAMHSGTLPPKATFTAMAVSENANSMAAVAGEDQTGHVSAPLDERLIVQVTDAFGNPIAGVPINWEAVGGGTVSDATVTTDDQGRASVERVLGPAAGQQTTVATSEGLAGSPVTFVHTALAGNASRLAIVSGDDQTGQVGSQLAAELVVRLIDGDGNGVPNTAVAWVVATGGGNVTPASSNTDDEGRASARWTLGGTPGANRLDAVVSGVGVASFDAIATAGAPAALSIVTQPSSSARNGVRLERQPVIQVRDAGGNAVARGGIQVSAAIGAGSGDLIGTRQRITDPTGQATFTDLAITGSSGTHTLVFSSSGYASATSNGIDVRAISTITTILTDTPDPSISGAAVTVGFQVTSEGPTPTGSVTVTASDGAASCIGSLIGGSGSCLITLGNTGDRILTATYSGAPGLNPSSGTEPHRVNAVAPPNQAPHADFSSHCEGLTCQFTDTSSDPDGQVTGWSWSFGDGSPSSSDRNPSHTYAGSGTFTVMLTATDNGGATNATSAEVKVNAPHTNKAPQAEFEVHCTDLTCTFTDKSKDGDGNIASWHWDFGDGQSSSDQNPSHLYGTAGSYHVTLTVTDNEGAPDSETRDANPTAPPNQPPTAEFTWSCAGLDCSFTDGSSDSDGTIAGWSWEFDDGTSSTSQSPSHSYLAGGTYHVKLTVTDNFGAGESVQHDVTVTPPPPPNQAPSAVPDNYSTPQDVALTVVTPGVLTNDTDPDGDPLTAQLSGSTANGTVSLQGDGSFTYTPNAGFTGDDSFSYTASDGSLTSTATVTITVNAP